MLSGLTIRGRCLLAAGAAATVCAIVLDERDLLRVAAFIAALPLLALLVAGRARVGLTARREVAPPRIAVGSQAEVRLRISGSGYLPVSGLLLEDEVPHALGGRPHFRLGDLPRRTGALLEYSVRPELRGIHRIGPLRTRISDPLGLCEFERQLGERDFLVAHPRLFPLSGLPTGSGLGNGGEGSNRMRPGHGDDDSMVRQYQHGDDIRRVHWKSTARRDELMVRVEQRPWYGGVTVLLDRRSAAHRGTGSRSSLEWAVSAAASICAHLGDQGKQPRLITEDGETLAARVAPAAGSTHYGRESMLDALAAVRASSQRDLVYERDPGQGQELIAVLGATTAVGVGELTRHRSPGTRSLALLLDVRAWQRDGADGSFDPEGTARRLRAAGWAVAVVPGPRASMNTAWTTLCRESGAAHGSGVPS